MNPFTFHGITVDRSSDLGAAPRRQGQPRNEVRIGLIVPSSNVTLERELPRLLAQREGSGLGGVSFHSSRVRMRSVTPEELAGMNAQAARAAQGLADASVNVVVYGCLVAVMAEGAGAHREAEARLEAVLAAEGQPVPVVSSARALVDTLRLMGATRVAVVAPYLPALTQRVCAYLENEGVGIAAARSLSVSDNRVVGQLDPQLLVRIARQLPRDVDAVVLSACVQMPSLPVLQETEDRLGVPVISAATATAFQVLRTLGVTTRVAGAGRLFSPAFDSAGSLAWKEL